MTRRLAVAAKCMGAAARQVAPARPDAALARYLCSCAATACRQYAATKTDALMTRYAQPHEATLSSPSETRLETELKLPLNLGT
jgi:hypothetical protein